MDRLELVTSQLIAHWLKVFFFFEFDTCKVPQPHSMLGAVTFSPEHSTREIGWHISRSIAGSSFTHYRSPSTKRVWRMSSGVCRISISFIAYQIIHQNSEFNLATSPSSPLRPSIYTHDTFHNKVEFWMERALNAVHKKTSQSRSRSRLSRRMAKIENPQLGKINFEFWLNVERIVPIASNVR